MQKTRSDTLDKITIINYNNNYNSNNNLHYHCHHLFIRKKFRKHHGLHEKVVSWLYCSCMHCTKRVLLINFLLLIIILIIIKIIIFQVPNIIFYSMQSLNMENVSIRRKSGLSLDLQHRFLKN